MRLGGESSARPIEMALRLIDRGASSAGDERSRDVAGDVVSPAGIMGRRYGRSAWSRAVTGVASGSGAASCTARERWDQPGWSHVCEDGPGCVDPSWPGCDGASSGCHGHGPDRARAASFFSERGSSRPR